MISSQPPSHQIRHSEQNSEKPVLEDLSALSPNLGTGKLTKPANGEKHRNESQVDIQAKQELGVNYAGLNPKERRQVAPICRSILSALKLDYRQLNPSRFSSELQRNEVYGELYLKVHKQCTHPDRNWEAIVIGAISNSDDLVVRIRIALLKAISDGLALNLIQNHEEVAQALIQYSSVFMESSVDVISEFALDDDLEVPRQSRKKTGNGPMGDDECSSDIPYWFHICKFMAEPGLLSVDRVIDLWKVCWKLYGPGNAWLRSMCTITMNSMVVGVPNLRVLRHLCSVLMSDKDSSIVSLALPLLSSLVEFVGSESTLVTKVLTFQALSNRHLLQDCLLVMKRIQANISKLEFEVFVEDVILRLLRDGSDEEKELCLDFISDICMPPTLYLNFDSDVSSTDLWESILKELGTNACPHDDSDNELNDTTKTDDAALCNQPQEKRILATSTHRPSFATNYGNHGEMTHLNRLSLDILLRVLRYFNDDPPLCSTPFSFSHAEPTCADVIVERKERKTLLRDVSRTFNSSGSDKQLFMQPAILGGILESENDAKGVARFFHESRELDKKVLGEFLSQGPECDYPFHADLRREYVALLSFENLTFPEALRKYLSNFRLPGEAQCIDRLMEVFSEELYRQQGPSSLFQNADAVYVLAFSTIMLQTDLHNPTIKTELRMTKEQFIRNNRGINSGEDLPESFVSDLYDKIKGQKLDVRNHVRDLMARVNSDFEVAWDETISQKCKTSVILSGKPSLNLSKAMFCTVTRTSLLPFFSVFAKARDPELVVQALEALDLIIKVSVRYKIHLVMDDVLQTLLSLSKEYILSCFANNPDSPNHNRTLEPTRTAPMDDSSITEAEPSHGGATQEDRIPHGFLLTSKETGDDFRGCLKHRGLIAVDRSFALLQQISSEVSCTSFHQFISCLCALRDVRALPTGMSNLDDFADSSGKVLPLSLFARNSQKRLDEYNRTTFGKDTMKLKGWFRSFFRKGRNDETPGNHNEDPEAISKEDLSLQAKALLQVAIATDVESIVQRRTSSRHEATIDLLLRPLDSYPFESDPAGEQNAVFSLELAARALLSDPARSEQSFLPFLSKFESILCKIAAGDEDVPSPFVIERIVVTILRSCIHLYSFDDLRPHMRASLQLLIMTLPRGFIRSICDRIACGLAIILRSSFQFFGPQEWTFMGDTLDTLANFTPSRVLVFDGIASTVEYSLPEEWPTNDGDVGVRPALSFEACATLSRILTRFVLGFYENDDSLTVPAMLCLEKVYLRRSSVALERGGAQLEVPDIESWQNVAVAIYSACRSPEGETSREGIECFRRNILSPSVEDIPSEKWVAIFYLIANKQPPVSAEVSRGNTFALMGQLFTHVAPYLSLLDDHREDLEDLVGLYTGLAEENLRQNHRGSLFKKTLQTLTYVSNFLVSGEWVGDKDFCIRANEAILRELERADLDSAPKTTENAREEEDVSEISDSAAESESDE